MAKGVVLRSTGSWYTVELDSGNHIECRLKGKFRLADSKYTNPVAVGDRVTVDLDEEQEGSVISEIEERKNYIVRRSPKHERARHIIAANIDQAILVATINKPRTSSGFIDRFLLTAEAYHIPAQIVFNKQDSLKPKDLARQEEWIETYLSVGYPVLLTSSVTSEGIEEFDKLLEGKLTLLSGHSGVGKSTLVNCVSPGLELRTQQISKKYNKGTHTTTFAEIFKLKNGGHIIDTPGIKEFGVLDLEADEVSHYFREMQPLIGNCKFNDCIHIDEPGCAIIDALEEGEISEERFKNYFNIVMDIKTQKPIY